VDVLFVVQNEDIIVCVEGGAEVKWDTFSIRVLSQKYSFTISQVPSKRMGYKVSPSCIPVV
jgi:hypothetical protein